MMRGGICLSLSGTQGFTHSCRGRQGKMKFPSLSQLITGTAVYAEQKIDTIKNDVAEGIRRGSSQMAGAYVKTFKFFSDPYLDRAEFWLGLGNSVLEQYSILAYSGEKASEIVANTKDGFLEGDDWLGNKVYEANIPIVSDLMGGLFDASSMEDSKNTTSVVGSIMNGGARSIPGTIDGLATIVTDPAGTVEGLVKMADAVDTVGDMEKIGDVTLDAARVIGGLWDDIGDAGKWVKTLMLCQRRRGFQLNR